MAILRKGNTLGVAVHHSVYKPANNMTELKAQAALFNGWHKGKGWAEITKTPSAYPYISYHYLLALDGSLLNVTDEKYVKYHAGDNFRGDLSFNLNGIAVCLTGNYENDQPTDAQMRTLVQLIRDIEKRYKIDARVRGHKETSQTATACPGKNLGTSKSGWLKQVISNVNDKNYPPAPPSPPEEPQKPPSKSECQTYITPLENEIKTLRNDLTASKKREDELRGEISSLSSNLEETKKELQQSEDRYGTLMIEKKTLGNTNADLVKELNELKDKNCIKTVIDNFFKWLRGQDK